MNPADRNGPGLSLAQHFLCRIAYAFGLASLCLSFLGCSPQVADLDADQMGRRLIDAVQRNDWVTIDKDLGPEMAADPQHAPKLDLVRAQFPTEPPWSIKLLSSRAITETSDRLEGAKLSYLYVFAERHLLIDLVVEQRGFKRIYEPPTSPAAKLLPEPVEEAIEPPKPGPGEKPYRVSKVYKLVSISVKPG